MTAIMPEESRAKKMVRNEARNEAKNEAYDGEKTKTCHSGLPQASKREDGRDNSGRTGGTVGNYRIDLSDSS